MLEEQLRASSDISKTDVDRYYETLTGIKKRKVQASNKKEEEEEETKGVITSQPGGVSFLEKCKKIGKLGPLVCKMNTKDSFGSWISKGNVKLFFERKNMFR